MGILRPGEAGSSRVTLHMADQARPQTHLSPYDPGSGLQISAAPSSFPLDFPCPLPRLPGTPVPPGLPGPPGPPPPCRQRERPQAWPLCNDQITGQAGRSDKRSIYFGAFSNPGGPHPTDENGETGGSVTPGPVSWSRRRAQTELKTIPGHQGKRQGLPGPKLEEVPLGSLGDRPGERPGSHLPPPH